MPALNISNIKDAKLGSTDLSAVYKGSTPIWTSTPLDPPTQEGHLAANAINLECRSIMDDPDGETAMYGRFYFLLPYESRYGTDNLKPSSSLYHPNQVKCEIYNRVVRDTYETENTLWQFTGWIEAYNSASPLGGDSVCEVDGLKYTRCVVPPMADPGVKYPLSGRISLKIKVVVPYYDDNPTFPATEDMYSRELTIHNDASGDYIYTYDLPSPSNTPVWPEDGNK